MLFLTNELGKKKEKNRKQAKTIKKKKAEYSSQKL